MSWLQWALAPPRGQGEEVPTGSDLESFLSLTLLHQPATTCGVLVTKDEIKRRLLLGRKAMTNLDSILKSRDISLPTRKKSYDQPRQHIKKQRHYFANKDPSSQSYGFSSSHVWM
ncbi:unnamed protein product [Rangifer tarandus platyrhynchus]|uniref:Uncharacterized protein n=2 Tax=Rangifer tarandus platyrhynchus TaxID=3082113 RepID=A0AC59Z5D5_RANTA|nr:unnamed protein product [Rangifer tarandus platyrhynchus]